MRCRLKSPPRKASMLTTMGSSNNFYASNQDPQSISTSKKDGTSSTDLTMSNNYLEASQHALRQQQSMASEVEDGVNAMKNEIANLNDQLARCTLAYEEEKNAYVSTSQYILYIYHMFVSMLIRLIYHVERIYMFIYSFVYLCSGLCFDRSGD